MSRLTSSRKGRSPGTAWPGLRCTRLRTEEILMGYDGAVLRTVAPMEAALSHRSPVTAKGGTEL